MFILCFIPTFLNIGQAHNLGFVEFFLILVSQAITVKEMGKAILKDHILCMSTLNFSKYLAYK